MSGWRGCGAGPKYHSKSSPKIESVLRKAVRSFPLADTEFGLLVPESGLAA